MSLQKIKVVNFCDKTILLSLYTITFFLPVSKAIIESFSILAIACYIIKKILQRECISKTHLNIAIFVYLIICFLSIFISSNLKISARTFFAKTLQNTVFFFLVVDTLNTEGRIKNIIYILLGSSLLLGIDGIYQYVTHRDFIRNRPYYGLARVHATFPTPNDFGCYLYSLIPFSIICFLNKFNKKRLGFLKIFSFLLFILLFICLTFTVSRGAWFAFLGGMLFMCSWIPSLMIIILAMGLLITFTQQFYGSLLKERLANFLIFLDHSSSDRNKIWETAWNMFMHRPWVGVGLGTFMFNFSKFVVGNYPYGVPYAHNCYLQMSSEIGIIGLLSFLSILILFFSTGVESLIIREKTFSWYVLLASLTAVLGYCIQMTIDTIFYSLDLGMLFWLLLGLGVAAMQRVRSEYSKDPRVLSHI